MLHRALALAALPLALALACTKETPPQPPAGGGGGGGGGVADAQPEPEPEPVCSHLVLVDAGSSGTRAYAYAITPAEGGGVPAAITQLSVIKTSPGIVAFKDDPAAAGKLIADVLKHEGGALDAIPKACHAKTPAAVMATGGMRLLEGEPGGEAAAAAIYGAIKGAIAEVGLDARFAGTISGAQEAIYGWLSVNYALGRLGGAEPTLGALDLGGASSSIVFVPEAAGDAPTTNVRLGDRTYAVYVNSYLGYGVDRARQFLNYDACFLKGVGKGTGKYGECVKKLEAAVKPKKCAAAACGLAAPGDDAKLGVAQPPIPASAGFYAFGVYEYARAFFKLEPNAAPAALAEAAGGKNGKAGYCATPWKQVADTYQGVDERYLQGYCFDAAWIAALLKTHGFAPTTQAITVTDKFGDHDASWALGAALCSLTGCLSAG